MSRGTPISINFPLSGNPNIRLCGKPGIISRSNDISRFCLTASTPPEGRGHHLRAHDITRGAGGGDHDIHFGKDLGKAVEGDGNALEQGRHFLGPGIGPVGDADAAHALADEVTGGQLRHLPGPDEEDAFSLEVPEDLLRQFDGRITYRDGVARDPRLLPDAFRHPKGVVQKPVEKDRRRAVFNGMAIGRLELPQDLRLSHDHRIETRRHAKEVAHRFPILVDVETAFQFIASEIALPVDELPELLNRLPSVLHAGEDLHPVAGRKAERFPDFREAHQLAERMGVIAAGELQPLPDFERGRFMVHADKNEAHSFTENRAMFGKKAFPPSAGRAG